MRIDILLLEDSVFQTYTSSDTRRRSKFLHAPRSLCAHRRVNAREGLRLILKDIVLQLDQGC